MRMRLLVAAFASLVLVAPSWAQIEGKNTTSNKDALTRDDVLDKFVRNTKWLYGDDAREVAKDIGATPESEPLRNVFRKLRDAGAKMARAAG